MKRQELPQIPLNPPVIAGMQTFTDGMFGFGQKDTFATILNAGDLQSLNVKDKINKAGNGNTDYANVLSKSLELRERVLKEQFKKEYDVEYIKENGFEYYPSNEYLKSKLNPTNDANGFQSVRDLQVIDAYTLSRSTNMLVTHQVRLGKTGLATIGAFNNKQVNKVLVICPKTIMYAWKDAIDTWTGGQWKADVFTASNKKAKNDQIFTDWSNGDLDVLIINIDSFVLKKNYDMFMANNNPEDLMIVDEAHFLTRRNENDNMYLKSAKAQKLLWYRTQKTKYVWLLTGTPTSKYEYEILSLFYFLSPIKKYVKQYGNAVYDNFKNFFERFMVVKQRPTRDNGYQFLVENRAEYNALMGEMNMIHRIHRTTAVEFPNKVDTLSINEMLHLSEKEKSVYKKLSKNFIDLFIKMENGLSRDMMLRKFSLDPRLLEKNIMLEIDKLMNHHDAVYKDNQLEIMLGSLWTENKDLTNARETIATKIKEVYGVDQKGVKAQWVLDYLKENKEDILSGKPIVIFSQFTSFLTMLEQDINEELPELQLGKITGAVTGTNRNDVVKDFQDGEINVLLCNISATKEGVTLNRSNTAIFTDRVYSNQVMTQVKARIENPTSQEEKANIFLMVKDSIDFYIEELNDIYNENTKYMNENIHKNLTGGAEDFVRQYLENMMN